MITLRVDIVWNVFLTGLRGLVTGEGEQRVEDGREPARDRGVS
jgi:hypothetical protein